MEQLPIDLKIEILNTIDEFSDLYSFIRTTRSIYDAFTVSKSLILASTMKRAVGKRLLRDAITLQSTQKLLTRDESSISRFLQRWRPGVPCEYPSPGTDRFNQLARQHTLIEFFTRDLLSTIASGGKGSGLALLLPAECIRIHRAFYRFELYCQIFTRDYYPTVDYDDFPHPMEVREMFINVLPHWEIEELSCIHRYLINRLHRLKPGGLNADTSHTKRTTSEVGIGNVIICANASTATLENVIALGLEHIYKLLHACGPIRQNQLLFHSSHPRAWWLGKVLQLYAPPSAENENEVISDRVYSKGSDGPNYAWLKLNGNNYVPGCCRGARLDRMYNWGYCLWSTPRLEAWKVQ